MEKELQKSTTGLCLSQNDKLNDFAYVWSERSASGLAFLF